MLRALICLTLSAAPAWAETCPPVPDRSDELAALFTEARQAETEAAGRAVSNRMWEIWADAPDQRAQDLLETGLERRGAYDFDGAKLAFDALVDYCPHYAEGYNQRAFIAYLRQDFPAALVDLERALDRSPTHVAALAGKALTQFGLGMEDAGQTTLRRALTLNPWLSERHLLKPERDDTF